MTMDGYVGLDLAPIRLARPLPAEWLYIRQPDDPPYVGGWCGDDLHVTLKYGLMRPLDHDVIDKLVGDVQSHVLITDTDLFGIEDAPWRAVVGLTKGTEEINARLSTLPHVDTFATYRPHVTFAYVNRGHATLALDWVRRQVWGRRIEVLGWSMNG